MLTFLRLFTEHSPYLIIYYLSVLNGNNALTKVVDKALIMRYHDDRLVFCDVS